MNATEIQKVATNGINEIPVCGLNRKYRSVVTNAIFEW